MDYQCNSCGKKFDPDDGYGDQKDYGVLIQELKDHQINHKFVYESKASETWMDHFERVEGLKHWDSGTKNNIFSCNYCGYNFDTNANTTDDLMHHIKSKHDITESKATEVPISDSDTNGLVWTCPKCSQQINYDTVMNKKLISYHLRSMHGLSDEQVINLLQKDFQNDWEIQRILMSGESKASEDDYEERAEWNWLTNKDPAPEVDYGQVDYEDDGVSDIAVPNAEPKDDKNEFPASYETLNDIYTIRTFTAKELYDVRIKIIKEANNAIKDYKKIFSKTFKVT